MRVVVSLLIHGVRVGGGDEPLETLLQVGTDHLFADATGSFVIFSGCTCWTLNLPRGLLVPLSTGELVPLLPPSLISLLATFFTLKRPRPVARTAGGDPCSTGGQKFRTMDEFDGWFSVIELLGETSVRSTPSMKLGTFAFVDKLLELVNEDSLSDKLLRDDTLSCALLSSDS